MRLFICGLFFLSVKSFAYTEILEFTCLNSEVITMRSSMMPDGSRYKRAVSSVNLSELRSVDCEEVEDKWNAYGSENCYVSEDKLFSHFDNLGMLRVIKNGRQYFTLCELTATAT